MHRILPKISHREIDKFNNLKEIKHIANTPEFLHRGCILLSNAEIEGVFRTKCLWNITKLRKNIPTQ